MKIAIKRTFVVDIDLKRKDLEYIRESIVECSIKQVVSSPSGNFLLANVGGVLFVLLDAHTIQIISFDSLKESEKSRHLIQVSNFHFLNENLLASVQGSNKILFWRMNYKKISPMAYLDCLDIPETSFNDYFVTKISSFLSEKKIIIDQRVKAHHWTKDSSKLEVTYNTLFDLKTTAPWFSFDLTRKSKHLMDDLRKMTPSLLIIIDSEMHLNIVWADIFVAMYGFQPMNFSREQVSAGYTLSSDKLIQGIKHNSSHCDQLLSFKQPHRLSLHLETKDIADIVISKLPNQKAILILSLNLQLQILSYDLLVKGFMEHGCYHQAKR